jgi:hypothetical protein
MADRDKIPASIPRHYRDVYQQMCELQDPEAVAQSALRPLRQSLQLFENSPINFMKRVAQYLQPMTGNSMLPKMANWDREHDQVQKFAEETDGNHDAIDLATRACCQLLNKLEKGEQIQDLPVELYTLYLTNILDAQIYENIFISDLGEGELDEQAGKEYLQSLRHHSSNEVDYFAQQLARHGNVNALTLPNRKQSTEELLDIDISNGLV